MFFSPLQRRYLRPYPLLAVEGPGRTRACASPHERLKRARSIAEECVHPAGTITRQSARIAVAHRPDRAPFAADSTVRRNRIRIYRFDEPSKTRGRAIRGCRNGRPGRGPGDDYAIRTWLHIHATRVPPLDRIFACRGLGIVTHLEGSAAAGNSLGGHGRNAGAGEGGLLGAEGDGRLDGGHVHGDGSHCALVGAMDTDASVRVRRAVMVARRASVLLFFPIGAEPQASVPLRGSHRSG